VNAAKQPVAAFSRQHRKRFGKPGEVYIYRKRARARASSICKAVKFSARPTRTLRTFGRPTARLFISYSRRAYLLKNGRPANIRYCTEFTPFSVRTVFVKSAERFRVRYTAEPFGYGVRDATSRGTCHGQRRSTTTVEILSARPYKRLAFPNFADVLRVYKLRNPF